MTNAPDPTPQTAKLGETQIDPRCQIELMRVGDTGYISPSAVGVDAEGGCWLRADWRIYTTMLDLFDNPSNTVGIARRDDGFHIWIPPDQTWTRERQPRGKQLPVAEIHHWPQPQREWVDPGDDQTVRNPLLVVPIIIGAVGICLAIAAIFLLAAAC